MRSILLSGLYDLAYGPRKKKYISILESRIPTFSRFLSTLHQGNAIGVSGYPWRAIDQFKVLGMVQPRRIVELGSGTSTGVFADYVRQTPGASLLSVDEVQRWAELTQAGLAAAGLAPHPSVDVISANRIDTPSGSLYDLELEPDIDLLYIDGPTVLVKDGHKTANQDIILYFNKGCAPQAIMVDVRIDTVEAILGHPASAHYNFTPGMPYLKRGKKMKLSDLKYFGAFDRHSVFVRKPGSVANGR